MTKTNTFKEHLQRAILETCDLLDLIRVMRRHDLTKKDNDNDKDKVKYKDNDKEQYI